MLLVASDLLWRCNLVTEFSLSCIWDDPESKRMQSPLVCLTKHGLNSTRRDRHEKRDFAHFVV